jgi:hypothetical protein
MDLEGDDLGGQFAATYEERRKAERRARMDALRSSSGNGETSEAAGTERAPASETGSGGPTEPAADANARPGASVGAGGDVSRETSAASISPRDDPGSAASQGDLENADRSWLGTVGAVAKDVLLGATEVPGQAVGGAIDAVNETLGAMESLDSMINQTLGLPEFSGYGRLPTTPEADTTTGGFVRSTAQFLTGFIPAMRGVSAVKGLASMPSLARGITAGAAADLVVWDPHEERLSTYLNEVPWLAPVV